MKIRNGFVSNSSSSSFCLAGWVVKEDLITRKDFACKMGFLKEESFLNLEDYEIDDLVYDCVYSHWITQGEMNDTDIKKNEVLIGIPIKNQNLTLLEKELKSMSEKIGDDLSLSLENVKFYFGERYC
jgi:hypothetical protein